jgi:hypothetical protein
MIVPRAPQSPTSKTPSQRFGARRGVGHPGAIADPHLAAQIERWHQAAVPDALSFIERHALSCGSTGRFARYGLSSARFPAPVPVWAKILLAAPLAKVTEIAGECSS